MAASRPSAWWLSARRRQVGGTGCGATSLDPRSDHGAVLITTEELAAHTLFAPLTPEQIAAVAGRMIEMQVPPGAQLAKHGDFGMRFFVIFTGTAEVKQGGTVIATLSDGNVFGEIGVSEGRRSADVVATTPMRLGALNKWDVDELSSAIPLLAERMQKIVTARRLRDLR